MSKMARVANYRQTSGQNDILKQNVDFNKDCKLEKKISTPDILKVALSTEENCIIGTPN